MPHSKWDYKTVPSRWLRRLYRRWNKEHFGGELPDIPVYWADLPGTTIGRTSFTGIGFTPKRIMISRRLKADWQNKQAAIILLHETIHVCLRGSKCGEGKDSEFYQEFIRLAKNGVLENIF